MKSENEKKIEAQIYQVKLRIDDQKKVVEKALETLNGLNAWKMDLLGDLFDAQDARRTAEEIDRLQEEEVRAARKERVRTAEFGYRITTRDGVETRVELGADGLPKNPADDDEFDARQRQEDALVAS